MCHVSLFSSSCIFQHHSNCLHQANLICSTRCVVFHCFYVVFAHYVHRISRIRKLMKVLYGTCHCSILTKCLWYFESFLQFFLGFCIQCFVVMYCGSKGSHMLQNFERTFFWFLIWLENIDPLYFSFSLLLHGIWKFHVYFFIIIALYVVWMQEKSYVHCGLCCRCNNNKIKSRGWIIKVDKSCWAFLIMHRKQKRYLNRWLIWILPGNIRIDD